MYEPNTITDVVFLVLILILASFGLTFVYSLIEKYKKEQEEFAYLKPKEQKNTFILKKIFINLLNKRNKN